MAETEELVFAVDLRGEEIERTARAIDGRADDNQRSPLPEAPTAPIGRLALLIDDRDDPLLLPIPPTDDVLYLDALARLIRVAVASGERIPAVAVNYGETLERRLAFERRLPEWAYTGIEAHRAALLPRAIAAVLGPKRS